VSGSGNAIRARLGRPSSFVGCTLGSRDFREQAERWRRLLDEAGLARSETERGLRLSFREDRAVEEELRTLVAVEMECCAWARWEIGHERGALVLDVSSTGAGVAALQTMFGGGAAA
jgi:hypothetical protein